MRTKIYIYRERETDRQNVCVCMCVCVCVLIFLIVDVRDNVLYHYEEVNWKLTKKRSRRYPAQTIVDYANDIALLANTSAQAETLLYSLKKAAAGIHVNAHKMGYMCLNQRGNNSTLNGSSLKQVDNFTYKESNVSSTETDINMRLAKAWTALDRLLIIWKSDLTDKMKHSFFQTAKVSILHGC